jgi:hypothetical protein
VQEEIAEREIRLLPSALGTLSAPPLMSIPGEAVTMLGM